MKKKSVPVAERYYVYALLDPRKPGDFRYRLPDGKYATFDHEPFYVGKGIRDRASHHVPTALRGIEQTFKARKIRRIHAAGLEVIEKRGRKLYDEESAYAYERDLIQSIGRYDLRKGPLTNLTDGGDGVVNLSRKARERMAQLARERWASMTPRQKKQQIRKYTDWWDGIGEDGRKAFSEQNRKSRNAYLSTLSDMEFAVLAQAQSARAKAWWESLTPEALERYLAKQRVSQTKQWAAVSDEERKAHGAKTVAARAKMSSERKELYTERKRTSAQSWYASLTPEQRAEMKRKQDAAKQNYPLRTCPHCGTQGKGGNMTRFHFDGCKQRP